VINGGVVENVVALRIQRLRRGSSEEDFSLSGRAVSTEDGIADIGLLVLQE